MVLEHVLELPAVDSIAEALVLKTICWEELSTTACSTLPLFYIRCCSIAIIKARFKNLEETSPRTSCFCFKRSSSFHQRKVVFLNLEQTSSCAWENAYNGSLEPPSPLYFLLPTKLPTSLTRTPYPNHNPFSPSTRQLITHQVKTYSHTCRITETPRRTLRWRTWVI
jgi:hypothetical protein